MKPQIQQPENKMLIAGPRLIARGWITQPKNKETFVSIQAKCTPDASHPACNTTMVNAPTFSSSRIIYFHSVHNRCQGKSSQSRHHPWLAVFDFPDSTLAGQAAYTLSVTSADSAKSTDNEDDRHFCWEPKQAIEADLERPLAIDWPDAPGSIDPDDFIAYGGLAPDEVLLSVTMTDEATNDVYEPLYTFADAMDLMIWSSEFDVLPSGKKYRLDVMTSVGSYSTSDLMT